MKEPGSSGGVTRPRVAVFVPAFGAPWQIWVVRQCLGFARVDPVLVCWERHPDAPAGDHGLQVHQLHSAWDERSLGRRIGARLGWKWSALPGLAERREIREALRALRVEAALCHFAWTGLRVSCAMGNELPVVWHVHGRDVSKSLRDPSYREAVRSLLPVAAEVVAVGSFQLDILRGLGLPATRGQLIPCGAPLAEFTRSASPPPRSGGVRFVTVCRLSPEKGILETVSAFARVHARVPDSELVVVGDGRLREPAEKLAAELGVADRVRLTGSLSPAEVARELAAADVFTQHSRPHEGSMEGFGVTLTEAGAAGLPLVASRFGGIVDQLEDGDNGILFEPGDVEGQARAMLELAQNEALRRRMGARAREVAQRFDAAKQIRRLEDLLLRVLAQAGDDAPRGAATAPPAPRITAGD